MKTLVLILIFSLISPVAFPQVRVSTSEVEAYTPMRVIGTNVFDFSPVIRAWLQSEDPRAKRYLVLGTVKEVISGTAHVVREYTSYQFCPPPGFVNYATSRDLLRLAGASSLASKGEMSAGQLLAMDPSMRMMFEPVEVQAHYYLTNYPQALSLVGKPITVFAWPVRSKSGKSSEFDFGRPYNPKTAESARLIKVSPDDLTSSSLPSQKERTEQIATRDAALMAWQQRKADEGYDFAQVEIALRYLRGEGVVKDTNAALRWLEAAKTNGNAKAVLLLDSLRRARSVNQPVRETPAAN